jgi:hypothetical protein
MRTNMEVENIGRVKVVSPPVSDEYVGPVKVVPPPVSQGYVGRVKVGYAGVDKATPAALLAACSASNARVTKEWNEQRAGAFCQQAAELMEKLGAVMSSRTRKALSAGKPEKLDKALRELEECSQRLRQRYCQPQTGWPT